MCDLTFHRLDVNKTSLDPLPSLPVVGQEQLSKLIRPSICETVQSGTYRWGCTSHLRPFCSRSEKKIHLRGEDIKLGLELALTGSVWKIYFSGYTTFLFLFLNCLGQIYLFCSFCGVPGVRRVS